MTLALRETLFGDALLENWPPAIPANPEEPWTSFIQAREALSAGRKEEAIQRWQRITAMPDLESRHYLQAWHFLRQQGIQPPEDKAKLVYGVVVEVAMNGGVDIVAAYQDRSARYYHHTGAGTVWERPNDSLDLEIAGLLAAGRAVVPLLGPWEGDRPPAPTGQTVRLTMLTPSGLHFGQGTFEGLNADPKGKLLLDAGTQLMLRLTKLPRTL